MKAERRHELQTNSLALWLRWRAPQLWQEHGTKVLIGLIAVLALVVLIRWRINAPREAAAVAENSLAAANQRLEELRLSQRAFQVSQRMSVRESERIVDLVRDALDTSDRADIQARAYAILGDYYWVLANWSIPPEAATRPALAPDRSPEQLLTEAQQAYERVLQQGSVPADLVARARFGLAAIAETRAFEAARKVGVKADPAQNPQWAAARQQYEAVLAAADIPQVLKTEAQWHLQQLTRLQRPLWIEPPSTRPATTQAEMLPLGPAGPPAPETAPSTTAPATQPAQ